MNASGQASISSVIAHSFKHEGMGWMFKGWTPAFIRLSPNTIIVLSVVVPFALAHSSLLVADFAFHASRSLTLEEFKKLVDKLRA